MAKQLAKIEELVDLVKKSPDKLIVYHFRGFLSYDVEIGAVHLDLAPLVEVERGGGGREVRSSLVPNAGEDEVGLQFLPGTEQEIFIETSRRIIILFSSNILLNHTMYFRLFYLI